MKSKDDVMRMKQPIELDGDFLLQWDNYGFILSDKKVFAKGKQAGKTYANNPTYHPNLEQLCEEYAYRFGQTSETLEEMDKNWKRAVKQIKKLLEE